MQAPPYLVLGFFSIFWIIGLIATISGMQRYQLAQKIKNTPTSKIRSVAVGLVELFGKANALVLLDSPITKNKCVYWTVIAQYYYKRKRSSGWRTFFRHSSIEQFYVEDKTGRILIEPKQAEVLIDIDKKFMGRSNDKMFFGLVTVEKLDPKVFAYLEANEDAKKAFNSLKHQKLRFFEHFVEENDDIYVLGSATIKDQNDSANGYENLIIKRDELDKILYISDKSEKEVLSKLNWTAWISILIGLGMLSFFTVLGILIIVKMLS